MATQSLPPDFPWRELLDNAEERKKGYLKKWMEVPAFREALLRPMTPAQKEEQRRSFVFGNVSLSNPAVTREMVCWAIVQTYTLRDVMLLQEEHELRDEIDTAVRRAMQDYMAAMELVLLKQLLGEGLSLSGVCNGEDGA